ncbi:phosphoenolpyruvate phosphomutase [Plectosphaerella cucumerina]|uniref:Phosphoenolpyruvate phosphomutase n=1 Tax=Plectosphaerella cucumerina TaxID=40658 RepID=A0A8K0X609_9PEZI|nr:phosphoenolpyruvate phosphomutase [Plectosphaerella cucumerina]
MDQNTSIKQRAEALRALLDPTNPAIAMASHNALSAKLVEEAGFQAVWVSGFEISASHAVPDASILPISVNLEITRSMSQATSLSLIVDIDTGFGNAVNVAYVVPQFAAAGAAAVVLEDKVFPKDSSLRSNGRHSLVSVPEFQGKIAAAKASSSLLVIARTEALIAGLGQEEALRRAGAYVEAGADAILVHSKQKTPDEIVEFCKAWQGVVPLVIVPTNYPTLGFDDLAALKKVGLIICGNHAIRAAVASMRRVFAKIQQARSLSVVEGEIASVQGSGGSKVIGFLDLIVKLLATGALIGILVILYMLNDNLSKLVNGDDFLRVVISQGGTPWNVATTVSNSFSAFRVQAE